MILAVPIEQIADDERQDQIGAEVDQPRVDFIHNAPLPL